MRTIASLLAVLLLGSCYQMQWRPGSFTLGPENEIVMSEGMRIEATNRYGTIQIEALRGTKRAYTWDGQTREVLLAARKARWYGSMGIYSPGDSSFASVNGIHRAVVQEGQQHFGSLKEAMDWLNQPWHRDELSYTNSGLVVGWSRTPGRGQLNVEVWQIFIDGKKPTSLPGAKDSAIRVYRP